MTTATATDETPTTAAPAPPSLADRILAACIDGGVVGFAWFTVLTHIWDIANGSVGPLLLVWLVTLPAPLYLLHRIRDGAADTSGNARPGWLARISRPQPTSRVAVIAFAVAAAVASLLLAISNRTIWRIGWLIALLAIAGALLTLLLRDRGDGDDADALPAAPPGPSRVVSWGLLIAVAAGIAFALFSLLTVTPSADDAYYANRVTWIAQHGTIPDRDTMFGDNQFSPLYSPGIGTYEVFAGGIAHVFGVAGPTMDFLVLGPLIAALIPLVLWRAILAVRFRRPTLGLLVALAFLIWSARGGQWFGTMVLRRPWQTKEFFAAAMVPLLYCYAALGVHRRRLRSGLLLVAATIASLGFTSSAAGLAPLVLVAVGIAGYLTVGTRLLWPSLAALVYPVICLLAYRLGGSSTAFNKTHVAQYKIPYDIWHWFIGTGAIGITAGLAISTGFLGSLSRPVRTMLGAGCLLVALALTPGVLVAGGPLLGGAPTAWRVMWVAPLPLLIVGAVSAVDALGARLSTLAARFAAPAMAAVLVGAFVVTEQPLELSGYTGFHHPRWDLQPAMLRAAQRLDALAPAGSVVAGPPQIALVAAINTTRTHSLEARDYYGTLIFRADPSLRMHQRIRLSIWLTGRRSTSLTAAAAARALHDWPVEALCLGRGARTAVRAQALIAAGYQAAGSDSLCLYFRR